MNIFLEFAVMFLTSTKTPKPSYVDIYCLRTIENMYLSCNFVLMLLIGVYHLEYVFGENEIDHTNVEGYPANHKDTKSSENFQPNHNDLDKRNLRGKSKGRNYMTSLYRKFYILLVAMIICTVYLAIFFQ